MSTLSLPQAVPPGIPSASRTVGELLREWRQRRRMSQLLLATEADISTRHLSFVESGRALPSREMVMHLAERLEVPLRARNTLLVAAGYAPLFRERPLTDPQLSAAREAVELVLKGHEPYPALAIDRHWTIVAANRALAPLVGAASAALLEAPVNALRLSLHPEGIASSIVNWHAWRAHVLARLQRQVEVSADDTLAALRDELAGYPTPWRPKPGGRQQRRPQPDRRAAASSYAARRTVVLQHDDRIRHARRRHPLRTRNRGVLPRRSANLRSTSRLRRRPGRTSCKRKRVKRVLDR